MNTNKAQIAKDLQQKTIIINKEFNAPVSTVWRAFTDSTILDQWWGPSPWRAETKQMNFRVGGSWLYAMVGPQGERHWARSNFIAIDPEKSFDLEDGFCDENGTMNPSLPMSKGKNTFTQTGNGTNVEMKITFQSEKDLQTTVEMGFEEGITICLEQLDALVTKDKN